jgi:hypothetical protein
MGHMPNGIALAFPDDEPIVSEFTPDAIEGVTFQEILKEIQETTTELAIDTRSGSDELFLMPRTSDGPVEMGGKFIIGKVTLPNEDNNSILQFAANYMVFDFSPEIEENPDIPGSILFTVDALRWGM